MNRIIPSLLGFVALEVILYFVLPPAQRVGVMVVAAIIALVAAGGGALMVMRSGRS